MVAAVLIKRINFRSRLRPHTYLKAVTSFFPTNLGSHATNNRDELVYFVHKRLSLEQKFVNQQLF
jgi:hypothetical protein